MAEHLRKALFTTRRMSLPSSGSLTDNPATLKEVSEAVHHYCEAIRHADLTSESSRFLKTWPKAMVDWPDLMAMLHQEKAYRALVLEQLAKCPELKASHETGDWIFYLSITLCWSSQRHDLWAMMNLLITRQPQLLSQHKWHDTIQTLEDSGMHAEASTLAKAAILASDSGPEIDQANEIDFMLNTSNGSMEWVDHFLLEMALAHEPAPFVTRLGEIVRQDHRLAPTLIWLAAKAQFGSLTTNDLQTAGEWTPQAKLLCSLELMTDSPESSRKALQP
jgi:hypothetical protein